jgi:WD40 repeat protein
LWDVATQKSVNEPVRRKGSISALAFSPDGKFFLSASTDACADLWDTKTGARIGQQIKHAAPVLEAALCPEGRLLVTAGEDGVVRLWDARSGTPIGPALHHGVTIRALAFAPDGKTLLTAGDSSKVHLWTVPSPIAGETQHVVQWTQTATNLVINAEGRIRPLDPAHALARRTQLKESSE